MIAALWLAVAVSAPPQELWAIGSGLRNSSLFRIEDPPSNPSATIVGDVGLYLTDIAFDPVSGWLYGCTHSRLYRMDTETAIATFIGGFGSTNMLALDADETGHLYGWNYSGLFRIDKGTGATTFVGAVGWDPGGDLAVESAQVAWGIARGSDLIRINLATGAGTRIGPTNQPDLYGLSVVGSDLIAGRGDVAAELFRVDRLTGAATSLGSVAGAQGLGIWGLAARPETLAFDAPYPGVAGRSNAGFVGGVAPGSEVLVLWSRTGDVLPIPGCPGSYLGLHAPVLFGRALADPSGVARLDGWVPARYAGIGLLAQAVEPSACRRSEVLSCVFR